MAIRSMEMAFEKSAGTVDFVGSVQLMFLALGFSLRVGPKELVGTVGSS